LKKQILALYNNNEDWRAVARTLGVKKATAYRWIKYQTEAEKQRGGRRRTKISDEHRVLMEQYIEENPRITLKQLTEKFQQDHQLLVSKECVRKHLDGLMFTLKDIRREPERANSDDNKTKRCEYVRKLLEYQADSIPIVYMDETNFNLFISRTKGRSKKGTRCINIAAGSRGSNIHVIGCIGNIGLIHCDIRRGAFKKPEAKAFIRRCLQNAQNLYQSAVVMVMDNAPCHTSIEEVFQEEEFRAHRLLRLSPYSPMLNPIELAWSILKSGVKEGLAMQMPQILAGENRANITQTEYRLQRLESIIQENITNKLTVANCTKFVAHIQRFIPDVINMVDMTY
jgi:transposase